MIKRGFNHIETFAFVIRVIRAHIRVTTSRDGTSGIIGLKRASSAGSINFSGGNSLETRASRISGHFAGTNECTIKERKVETRHVLRNLENLYPNY
jgi:hypothetical protein